MRALMVYRVLILGWMLGCVGAVTAAVEPQTEVAMLKKEAVSVAEQVAAAFPDDSLAHALLGAAHYNMGQTEAANRHLKRCLELNPAQGEAYSMMARGAYEKGELEECVSLSRQAIRTGAPTSEILNQLGRAEKDLGRTEDAIRTLEQAVGMPNPASESFVLLGQCYLQSGNQEQAKRMFLKAVEMVPDHTQAYFGLFTATLRLGQAEEAARFRERFLKLEEADRRTHSDRSSQEDTLTGLPMVRETVARTFFGAAQIQRGHGQNDKALGLLKRACVLDDENPQYRALLEALYLERKALGDGLAVFKELVSERPRSAMNVLFMGRFQVRMQDGAGAEHSFRKVMELAPKRSEGHRSLADLFYRTGQRLDEAVGLAKKVIELEPSGSNYHLLALIYLKQGNRGSALEAVREAVARSPREPRYSQLLQKLQAAPQGP